ncbi:MAG: hypothetical protein M0Q44_15595 [Methylobacter sp.]|nr:hypothetical protein [Methylobacter sp.]
MKKRKNPKRLEIIPPQNPVAKYAHLFNKAQTFCDKSKYSRKAKHPRQEATPMVLSRIIGIASCFTLTGLFPAGHTHLN